jgi:hypothetical protein
MKTLPKFWRDRAYAIHQSIKEKDIRISRGWTPEIFGAFLTYFTRAEMLDSPHGDALLDLLEHDFAPKPYVILDDDLGVKRIARLLTMPTSAAKELVPLFVDAFDQRGPGRVFRDEDDFVGTVVEPRVLAALRSSEDVLHAFSALESDHIRFVPVTWDQTDQFYRSLPRGVPVDPEDLVELQKLRDVKGGTWTYRQMFDLQPTDAAGNLLEYKYQTWCTVRIDFEKVDRAFIAAGEYTANVYGAVARAWSHGGPFDKISEPDIEIQIAF